MREVESSLPLQFFAETKEKSKDMETGVTEIKLKDGRTFRVHTANYNQYQRLNRSLSKFIDKVDEVETALKGVHTIKQFEKIIKTL